MQVLKSSKKYKSALYALIKRIPPPRFYTNLIALLAGQRLFFRLAKSPLRYRGNTR